MTDLTPKFSFGDAFREAEAAARAAEKPAEDTVEDAAPERPRDEQGRFVAAETPAETADTVENVEEPAEDVAATESDPELDAYLAKYGGDTSKALKAAVEAQKLIGRKASETTAAEERVAQLEAMLEQRFNALEQNIATPSPVQITQELVDENPAYATALAYEQKNPAALQVAYEAWKTDDPASAGAWLATRQSEQAMQQQSAAYEERIRQLEARVAPLAERTVQDERATHMRQLVTEIPAIADFVSSDEISQAAEDFPALGRLVAEGDPAQQAEAIKTLFLASRGRASDTLKANVQDVARAQAEEARKAAEDAYVASTTTATSTEPVVLTAEQQVAARMTERFKARHDLYESGWERPGN